MATTSIESVILTKKVANGLQELMTKTHESLVYLGDIKEGTASGETLQSRLASIKSAATTVETALRTLLGVDTTNGAITASQSIQAMIDAVKTELEAKIGTGDELEESDYDTIYEWVAAIDEAVTTTLPTTITNTTNSAKSEIYTKLGWGENGGILDGTNTVKKYIDDIETKIKEDLSSAFHYKGTKDKLSELKAMTSGNQTGDVYHVVYDDQDPNHLTENEGKGRKIDAEFAWDGSKWEELGSIVDLSNYTTLEKAEQIGGAAQAYSDQKLNAYKLEATEEINTAKNAAIQAANEAASSALSAAVEAVNANIQAANEAASSALSSAIQAVDANVQAVNTAAANAQTTADAAYTAANARARVFVQSNEPEGLTEQDLWFKVVTSTPVTNS